MWKWTSWDHFRALKIKFRCALKNLVKSGLKGIKGDVFGYGSFLWLCALLSGGDWGHVRASAGLCSGIKGNAAHLGLPDPTPHSGFPDPTAHFGFTDPTAHLGFPDPAPIWGFLIPFPFGVCWSHSPSGFC